MAKTVRYTDVDRDRVDENGCLYSISECGEHMITVVPVMYGFRVCAGYQDSDGAELNYCAGDQPHTIGHLYSFVRSALELTGAAYDAFPIQRIKPFVLDPVGVVNLAMLAGFSGQADFPWVVFSFDELYQKRKAYLNLCTADWIKSVATSSTHIEE